jgi:hypothetical protein
MASAERATAPNTHPNVTFVWRTSPRSTWSISRRRASRGARSLTKPRFDV